MLLSLWTARPESCLAGEASAWSEQTVLKSLAFWKMVFLQDPISFLFLMERAEVVTGSGEVLAAACSQFCLQEANVLFSFFLLGRTLRGALPVGCIVGNKTEKKKC